MTEKTERGKVLGIIPARSGSKGIPGKNSRILGGKPLIAHTIDPVREMGLFDRIILTTDSMQIAGIGRQAGVEVPFIRPGELARDDTPMLPVLQHAISFVQSEGWQPDIIVILQPTAPFRRQEDLAAALELMYQTGCDSVVSVVQIPEHYSPQFVMKIEDERLSFFLPEGERVTRRQDAKPAYSRSGHFYVTRTQIIMQENSIYGSDCRPIIIPEELAINLDTESDWKMAENWVRLSNGRE